MNNFKKMGRLKNAAPIILFSNQAWIKCYGPRAKRNPFERRALITM